jgi:hypothetical protein
MHSGEQKLLDPNDPMRGHLLAREREQPTRNDPSKDRREAPRSPVPDPSSSFQPIGAKSHTW